jgi:hypothetical protein
VSSEILSTETVKPKVSYTSIWQKGLESKKVAEKKAAAKAKGMSKAKPRTKQVVEDDDESMSDEPGLSRDRGGSEEEDAYESSWYVTAADSESIGSTSGQPF